VIKLSRCRLHGGIDEGRVALWAEGSGSLTEIDRAAAAASEPPRTYWRDDTKRGGHERLTRVNDETDADLVSSLTVNGMHAPALDIDMSMSTTWDSAKRGRTRYSFDARVPRDAYLRLLTVGRDVGLFPADFVLRRAPRVERASGKYLGSREDPAIELHVPTWDIESSTPGHSHLYIDHELSWTAYRSFLEALQNARILQGKFFAMACRREMTLLLTPSRTKAEMQKRFEGYTS
jgi:hypothetical protein